MKRNLIVAALWFVALALWPAVSLQAAVVGQFTEVEGRVDLLRGGNLPTIQVKVQDAVEPGDVVRTKSVSRAQIKFVDDTTLTIAPESRVAIEEYMYDAAKGQRQAVLQIFRGLVHTVVAKVIKTEQPNFVIKTHTTTMGVRGTTTYTSLNHNSTDIFNERGSVRVRNILPEIPGYVDLGEMHYTRVAAGLPPTVPMPFTPEDLEHLRRRFSGGSGLSDRSFSGSQPGQSPGWGTVFDTVSSRGPVFNLGTGGVYNPPSPATGSQAPTPVAAVAPVSNPAPHVPPPVPPLPPLRPR